MPKRKKSSPTYPDLEASISRNGLCKKQIAETIGISPRTLSKKLVGEYSFTLDEAKNIKQSFFPEKPLDELFKKNAE